MDSHSLLSTSFPFSAMISAETDEVSKDPHLTLLNLSVLQRRVDSLQQFLSQNVQRNTLIGRDKMDLVSNEMTSVIQQVILNGISLLACYQQESPILPETAKPPQPTNQVLKTTLVASPSSINKEKRVKEEIDDGDYDILELDAEELLAVKVHRCEICGKGFKRDANLRMHKRAHGNQYKTLEALTRPDRKERSSYLKRKARFSCPFNGCNRNKLHGSFKPLKSAICLKNHFKRSHCPKLFSCNRCHKKSFSVVADLKSHQKHCGKLKWRCSCGWSFPRKDKLFGHMALFEGHMPAFLSEDQDSDQSKGTAAKKEDDDDEEEAEEIEELKPNPNYSKDDPMLLDGMLQLESFGGIIGGPQCLSSSTPSSMGDPLQDIWWSGP